MREEPADSANTGSWLVFRVGSHVLSASALQVEGIIQRPERINRLPSMARYALGVFMFRGEWPMAVSLRRKLEVEDGTERTEGVFIVARVRNALIAFGVDEVKEVIDGSEVAWQPMPEMPAAELFDRYAIRDGGIVLRTGFESLLEAKTGMHAVAQWTATRSTAAAVDTPAPAPEEHKSVAAPVAATATELPPAPPQPAARSPEPLRKTLRSVRTTRRPPLARLAAPRLHLRPELRVVPPQAVQPEAPAIDETPAPPAPAVEIQTRTRKAAASPAYWFGAAALAAAVLTGAWFAYAPAPAPAAATASRPVTTGPIRQEQQPVVAAVSPAAPPAPAISEIKSETFSVTIERPAKAGGNTRVHVVVRGDTLSAIARTHLGDGLRYRELAQLSRIDNPHRIYPGDVVRLEVREKH